VDKKADITKVYLVLFHDQWGHSECESGCCCATTTEVKAVCLSQELAEKEIKKLMARVSYDRKEFEIEEMELISDYEEKVC